MNRPPLRNSGFLLATGAVLALLLIQISDRAPLAAAPDSFDVSLKEMDNFIKAYSIVQAEFADTTKLDSKKLIEGAINGMLETLGDPHVRFLPRKDAEELKVQTEGEFGGIGISIGVEEKELTVISPLEGTPAWKAGVEAGDIISKIEGDTTYGMDLEEAVRRLRGRPGTSVALELTRKGIDNVIRVSLVREIIRVRSVRYAPQEEFGYIRLSTFNEHTAEELDQAIRQAATDKVSGLILDLRFNSGGVLTGAIAVTNRFIDSGVIVSVVSRDPSQTVTYTASSVGVITSLPLTVLVNKHSASASEIVAGAVQDHGRGVIIGTKSYGKGSVQTVESLPDGSDLVLTTARYFTPSGRSIHGVGIDPDISVDFPAFTDSDRLAVNALFDSNIVKEYFFGKTTYTDDDVDALDQMARKAGIILSRDALEWQIVRQLARQNDDRIYLVPHLDPQLKKALDVLRAGRAVSPRVAEGR